MQAKRKILLYTHALTGGGAERVWALLASGLTARGHDVIFAVDFDAPQNESFIDPRVRRVTLGGGHWRNAWRLARLIRREKPDVTISALSASNLKHAIAALIAMRPRRAIISWHGYASSEPQLLSRIGFFATSIISRLTAASICVSDGLQAYMIATWRSRERATVRIYNPVDGGPMPPPDSQAELSRRPPLVLSAGRFVSYKQFPRLVRAFSRLNDPTARLVILGEGPERKTIEAEVAALGLTDRVSLPGYVSQPWRYYAQASCFALASSQEPFGLVVVEALANGLPIVATDCEGPREILADGRFGALPAVGDEAALTHALDTALAAPGEPGPRVERARDFSLDRGLDEYEALIERVIGAPLRRASPVPATTTPRKILLYAHSLTGGGAERAITLLASGLARHGHAVTVAIDYGSADNGAYLDPRVKVVRLSRNHFTSLIRLTQLLREEAPDVSISAMGGSNIKHALAALCAGRRNRAILSYHGFFESEPRFLSRMSYLLTPLLTRVTARTVAVSNTLREALVGPWRASAARTTKIYNPIFWGDRAPSVTPDDLKSRPPLVLASGRLVALKQFDMLLRAFARLERTDARLVILGEGPERARLEGEIQRLGLDGRVEMPGYVAEPWEYYDRASCLAISSRSESFGMVVVEALAHGLPVVTTDCRGPTEILANARYGSVVPVDDEGALTMAIEDALRNPGDPPARIARAQKFSPERAVRRYERLIESVCEDANVRRASPSAA